MPKVNTSKGVIYLFIFISLSHPKINSQINFDKNTNLKKVGYFSNRDNDSLFHYARKMQKSKNPCNADFGIIKEAHAYYRVGNYSEAEKKLKSIILKIKAEICHKRNRINALNRLFWIKKHQNKYKEAYHYLLIADTLINTFKKDLYSYKIKSTFKSNKALIKTELNLHNESNNLLLEIISDFEKNNIYKSQKLSNNFLLQKASTFNMIGDNHLNLYDKHLDKKYIDSADIYYLKAHLESKKVVPKLESSDIYYSLRRVKLNMRRSKYNKSLNILNNLTDKNHNEVLKLHSSYFKAIIFEKTNQLDSSLHHSYNFVKLNKKQKNHIQLIKIHQIFSRVYSTKKEIDSALKYSNLTIKNLKKIKDESNNVFIDVYQNEYNMALKLNKKIIINQSKLKNKYVIIIFILVFFISSLWYLLKKKKSIPIRKTYNINKTIKKELLQGIQELENSKDFLNLGFSIQFLAKKLNTNTSYLSYTINRVKNQSFKQYITELRINYLIKKLQEENKFRRYTIKALGEEIGYSNASAFTRAFKKYKGVTPSEYIKSLK